MNKLLINFKDYKLNFINDNFKLLVNNVVYDFFPKLNKDDIRILVILTNFIINLISNKNGFKNEQEYYNQWTQNNNRDIKGVILLLLPFIKGDDNNKITDLNQLLYAYNKDIPKSILSLPRDEMLFSHFEYGNMGIGLLNNNSDVLLKLNDDEEKLIYKIIYNNLLGLIQTLDIINGKLYINWVNVIPLNLDNYTSSDIYNNTPKVLVPDQINYSGLWTGDFYNVIRIKYYEESKRIKWFIFPYETERKYYLIQRLNEMLDLDKIIVSPNFNDLEFYEQNEFKTRVDNLMKIVDAIDFEVVKYFLIYLVNNYSQKNKLKGVDNFKIGQNEDQNDFDNNDYTIINNIQNNDILECLKKISLEYLWDYLKESLILFQESVFSKFIIQNDKINSKYYYEPFNTSDIDESIYKNKLNLKNIYNIAKSLSHLSTDKWELLEKNYISLSNNKKKIYFNKINGVQNHNTWINLKKNFDRQFINKYYNYDKEINQILSAFKNIFIKLVFEELVTTGILNKFSVNTKITDKTQLPSDFSSRKQKIKSLLKSDFNKNKEEWLNSYYYLTNKKFKSLGKSRLDKKIIINPKDKYDEHDYFDLITLDHEWFVFYAMDWISQISFFQHYIYHQVLYVTGATGQGKSTQVPKLLLYALKVIDYKSDGKVICTQPRITPTIENASRIAEELGVPILQTCNTSSIKIQTNNYNIQYKHQNDAHINRFEKYFLRIVTDGTLLEELKNNPTMFQKANDKIINKNIYDVIIVDEAHEHNTNMDIIIALAKQTCYFNNTVRLIIVSATMDDDEPIYRRYFSEINDNLLFPIKFPLTIDEQFILPQTKYMDRRYHISPPGETTQYNVEEYYLNYDPKDDKEAQELGYKKIIEICEKTSRGEILFFANGQKEIMEAVKYLNEKLPAGNIALPYFANLNETYKNMITNINIKINNIKNKRENIFTEWRDIYIEDSTVQPGIYKRAIIIATNVAEASITIPGLSYVVDNGYAKVNFFAPDLNKVELKVDKISEASRLQRKGRVGRVGDGIVYYMYKKNARKYIKPKYKITQEDMAMIILGLVCTKTIDDINIDDGNNPKLLLPFYSKDSKLKDIYNENYKIDNQINYLYYDNNKITRPFLILNNGQVINNLLDINGIYYLIHPFENYMRRNILNNIIVYNNIVTNNVPMIYYKYIFNFLINKNLIGSDSFITYEDLKIENRKFTKTELSDIVLDIIKNLSCNINTALTLLAAASMNCSDQVYEIIILLEILNNNIKLLTHPDIKWYKFKQIYQEKNDIVFLYNFIQKIKKQFIIQTRTENYEKIYEDFKKSIKLVDPNIDINLWNKLFNLKNNNQLEENYKNIIIDHTSEYNINYSEIDYWAKNNYFNPLIIKSLLNRISRIQNYETIKKYGENFNINFLKHLTDNTIEEKITRSFIYGSPIQFAYTMDNKNNSISWMNYKHYKVNFTDTLTTLSNDIVYFINYIKTNSITDDIDEEEKEVKEVNTKLTEIDVSILCPINIQWIISACPQIVNPRFDISKNVHYSTAEEIINITYFNSPNIQRIRRELFNNWKIYNLWDNKNMPILRYYFNLNNKL
jgi:hypothetical protein